VISFAIPCRPMPFLASQKDLEEDSLDESKSRADKRAVRAQPRTGGRWARGFRCDPGRWLLLLRNFFRRWYTLGLLLIVAMCLHADQNLAAPNLSAIAEDFDLTPLEKDSKLGGQVQLGFFFVGGATSLALGPLADRLNRVNLLLAVVILGSVPCALIKYIPSGDSGFLRP
ncbi:Synaptic vesicle glycoprotein 2A, partial [Durusdinium trenchii]